MIVSGQLWAEKAFVDLANGRVPVREVTGYRAEVVREVCNQHALSASTFMYLTRRFGPPPAGFDGHKEAGCWRIPVKAKGFVVTVSSTACRVGVGVGHDTLNVHNPSEEVFKAVVSALRGLFRPVRIRDVAFTPAGIGGQGREVEPFKFCGYGVLPSYWRR